MPCCCSNSGLKYRNHNRERQRLNTLFAETLRKLYDEKPAEAPEADLDQTVLPGADPDTTTELPLPGLDPVADEETTQPEPRVENASDAAHRRRVRK